MQRIAIRRRVVAADRAARFHRVGDDAVVVEAQRHNMGRAGERRVDRLGIAGVPVEADIARHLRDDLWRAWRTRGGGGAHRGQRYIVHGDQFGGVERLRTRLCNDQSDRFADMAHLVPRQQRLRREGEGRAGLHVRLHGGPHRLQSVRVGISAGEHRECAGRSPRGRGVDTQDLRMGVRRAKHNGMHKTLEAQVIEIGAVAGNEARVLPPPGRIADH
jgi:hypothetical protein